jgi:ParB-like chromosome segregation protein Spo0J
MKDVKINIAEIYIPTAKRGPIDADKVQALAESIAEIGQQAAILVRPDKPNTDKARYVLVSGLHRLEACKALGETTIKANIVQAAKH